MPLSWRLKLGSMLFGALWALVMFWLSGNYGIANGVILAVLGAGAGYVWYRLMRRKLPREQAPKQQ
jgi:dipeptide/tripeptide permease